MFADTVFAPSTAKPQFMFQTLKSRIVISFFLKGKTCYTKTLPISATKHKLSHLM